ncbi:hypothetical protein [Kaarinaea lacus]
MPSSWMNLAALVPGMRGDWYINRGVTDNSRLVFMLSYGAAWIISSLRFRHFDQ